MKKILTYKGAAMSWECDSNRHMNVMYYVNKFEHAGRHFSLEMGLTDLREKDEVGVVVLEQRIKYLKEVFEDDLLYIESSLIKLDKKAFTVLHEMYNKYSKELVSTTEIVLVLFDRDSRRAMPFPEEKRTELLNLMADA